MRRLFFGKKGQSTLEYAILISALALALAGVHVYAKRALTGRMRDASDDIGGQYSMEHGQSYAVDYSEMDTTEESGGVNTITDIAQYRGSRETVKTPDLGDEADAAAIPHDDEWETGWGRDF